MSGTKRLRQSFSMIQENVEWNLEVVSNSFGMLLLTLRQLLVQRGDDGVQSVRFAESQMMYD